MTGIRTLEMCAHAYLTILDPTGIHYFLETIFTIVQKLASLLYEAADEELLDPDVSKGSGCDILSCL